MPGFPYLPFIQYSISLPMKENWLFRSSPWYPRQGLGLIRIVTGLLLAYHGLEVFDAPLMQQYLEWEAFSGPTGKLLVYAGKIAELLAGILFTLGLFTRVAALLTVGTLGYITFALGQGKFWYEDQHPFLFVLLGLLFFFTGPGIWCLVKPGGGS